MTNLKRRLELANEAKELIIEFRNEQALLGESLLQEVTVTEDGSILYVEEYAEEIKYKLEEISSVLSTDMRGWGPCPAHFYEAIEMAKSEAESEYKNMSKEEYIQYVGGLYYIEQRCEEIFKRLQQIERESEELSK